MGSKTLKLGSLLLDQSNPRVPAVESQRDALQQILNNQKEKLANLAEDIAELGMNPADNFLVIRSPTAQDKFVVLEGNRRLAALKILNNPNVISGLEVSNAIRKRLDKAAAAFKLEDVEPFSCFEFDSREDGNLWIERRHMGEDEGRGIVNWDGQMSARFRGNDPALQALEFVRQNGQLTDSQLAALNGRFISTLGRLIETPDVANALGLEIKKGQLLSHVEPVELIKGLRRVVLDLAEKKYTVTQLKKKPQMVAYVNGLDKKDKPDLRKRLSTPEPVDGLLSPKPHAPTSSGTGTRPAGPRSRPTPPRLSAVSKPYVLNVTNAKANEIYEELKSLKLENHPHAIAVLMRVFLEISVDCYMTTNKIPKTVTDKGGHTRDKSLRVKVEDTVKHLVAAGESAKDFSGITRAMSHSNHPLSADLLNDYVHNKFVTPIARDLTAAWDNALPLFERIWK